MLKPKCPKEVSSTHCDSLSSHIYHRHADNGMYGVAHSIPLDSYHRLAMQPFSYPEATTQIMKNLFFFFQLSSHHS